MTSDEPSGRPDIEFSASVQADELRFHDAPVSQVRFPGRGDRITGQRTIRKNVDSPVTPGEQYVDVVVETTIAAELLPLSPDESRRPGS